MKRKELIQAIKRTEGSLVDFYDLRAEILKQLDYSVEKVKNKKKEG